ncbi:MAG: DMT family transporter [Sedimentisphaerales bacterium]|nr:DMT family transporter [Sedimentisphaerales bacterium]HNY80543.1 DMT family transporter [Sedimentisphaerales bacterium]HOC65312.1 DMT family transporter [Sedimentisphaerales bacterium]HOH66351.1 DMT family transporter [Sedimentisphaerales bacterium]HQA92035.1 DMT family transporter [Sedimentisphaerales bacterium]
MNESTPKGHRIDMVATAASLGALCCWSIGPIFIKQLTGYVDSWTQNALRYTVACLFWLPVLLHFMCVGRFDHRTWRLALLPVATNVAMQSLWAAMFYYINPGFAALLSKTSVLWVALFSLVFFADERPLARSRCFWLGLTLSAAGVCGVLYFKPDFTAARTLWGVLIALVCAVMWAAYAVAVKVRLRDVDSRCGFAVISLYTTLGLWIGAILFGHPARTASLRFSGWTAVIVSGITAIALGHVCFYTAIKRIGATLPSLVILAQPFVVFSISSVVFGERLTLSQLAFGALLLAGAGLSVWAQEDLRTAPQGPAAQDR